MLKETTASFDEARTHDWQASTDNEDHMEIMCQGTRELGLLEYGLTTGVEAMLTSGIWQYNLLIVITFTRLINLRLSRVAFENRVDLNLNFLLKTSLQTVTWGHRRVYTYILLQLIACLWHFADIHTTFCKYNKSTS